LRLPVGAAALVVAPGVVAGEGLVGLLAAGLLLGLLAALLLAPLLAIGLLAPGLLGRALAAAGRLIARLVERALAAR
jgi:hypothetical protein